MPRRSLDHLSPFRVVSLVILAVFPEAVVPNAVNQKGGDMMGHLWGIAAGLG